MPRKRKVAISNNHQKTSTKISRNTKEQEDFKEEDREYLDVHIMPALFTCMRKVLKEKPEKPLTYLAQSLVEYEAQLILSSISSTVSTMEEEKGQLLVEDLPEQDLPAEVAKDELLENVTVS